MCQNFNVDLNLKNLSFCGSIWKWEKFPCRNNHLLAKVYFRRKCLDKPKFPLWLLVFVAATLLCGSGSVQTKIDTVLAMEPNKSHS
jgi:hypothetical protein